MTLAEWLAHAERSGAEVSIETAWAFAYKTGFVDGYNEQHDEERRRNADLISSLTPSNPPDTAIK